MSRFRIIFLNKNNDHLVHQVKIRLEWHGYQIDLIDNEAECLVKLHAKACDLLLFECPTSSLTDLNFLRRLKDQKIIPKTILINSEENFQLATKAMQLGCVDYVIKDVLIQNYLDRLNHSIHLIYEQHKPLHSTLMPPEKNIVKKTIATELKFNWEYYPEKDVICWQDQNNEHKTEITYEDFIANILQNEISKVKINNNICLFSQKPVKYQFHYINNSNQLNHYQAEIQADIDAQGIVKKLQGKLKKLSTKPYNDENKHLKQSYLENTTDAFFVTDQHRKIVSVNASFLNITGLNKKAVINQPTSLLNPEQYDDDFFSPIVEKLFHKKFWQGELLIRHHLGHYMPVWQSISCIVDSQGKIIRCISVFRDMSRQKANEASIQFQANYDPLTQLPNRTLFLDRLSNSIKHSKRNNKKLALILLDLDKFKWINDNLGHHAGDTILVETAKKMQSAIRKSDTVCRLAGDEFTIILPNLDNATDTELIVQKIFDTFKQPVYIDHQEIYISGSLGITIYPDDGEDIESLQRNADSAMYKAKNLGRNCHYYYTRSLQEESEKRLRLLDSMRAAIKNHEFSLHYQPIINIATRKIAGAETLLRWKQPHTGYKHLDSFIPAAEQSGIIREIGNWTISRVAENIKRWQNMGLPSFPVSLNQSAVQYYPTDCCQEWLDILHSHDVSPSLLNFEIHENVLSEDKTDVVSNLTRLKKEGVKISLDGFGTGRCSLTNLQEYPLDIIKIDRSFIHKIIDDDHHAAAMVDSISQLADRLGIDVVATGVENSQQLARLNQHCRYAQGYYFSRPLPLDEFEYFLKRQNPSH